MRSSREAVILALVLVIPILIVVASIFGSFSRSNVALAAYKCDYVYPGVTVKCCDTITDDEGIEQRWCTLCDNTHPPSNCTPRYQDNSASGGGGDNQSVPRPPGTIEQPPTNVAPSTKTCPDGSAPDANGNCPPPTTNQQVAPPQNLASNNPQPEHHHHKGQDSTTKKDNDGGSQQAPS
jgi:hypothetical protein